MASETLRFGFLGSTKYAKKLLSAITSLSTSTTIVAIADTSLETASNLVTSNNLPNTVKVYGSYDELLQDPDVDAVYVPLPVTQRARWTVEAARKGKHVLVEKPAGASVEEVEEMVKACEENGVQFMDATLWLHHLRTERMKELVVENLLLGDVHYIYSTMTTSVPPAILDKLSVDAFGSSGAIGELGWYPIGAVLWVKDYQLPTSVTALPSTVTRNSAGVILSCTASLHYDHPNQPPTAATIHFSFHSHLSMDLAITGSKGSVHVKDYVIPFQEDSASFEMTLGAKFVDMHIGWNVEPEKVTVDCSELTQERVMVQEFARIVNGIRKGERGPDRKWPEISQKTQLVVDAVKKSLDLGCRTVYL